MVERHHGGPLKPTPKDGQTSVGSGSGGISTARGSSFQQPFTGSGPPVKDSNKQWRLPNTVNALAAQANTVSTLLLNGKIDLETARTYSALLRGVAQLVGIEVTTARVVRRRPNLDLTDGDDDEISVV